MLNCLKLLVSHTLIFLTLLISRNFIIFTLNFLNKQKKQQTEVFAFFVYTFIKNTLYNKFCGCMLIQKELK